MDSESDSVSAPAEDSSELGEDGAFDPNFGGAGDPAPETVAPPLPPVATEGPVFNIPQAGEPVSVF